MLLILILLGACAYLWSEQRKLLELRVSDATRLLQEKGEEIKSKDAHVLALTSEVEGLEKQLLLLSQVNEELERRIVDAEGELRRTAAQLEEEVYSTVATKDKELATLESGLSKEIQKLLKDKKQLEMARDKLKQQNMELRDRVSEYHRRVNDGNYNDEAPKPSRLLYDSPSPHQGHRRHEAIGGVKESEREASFPLPDDKIWSYTIPHGMGL